MVNVLFTEDLVDLGHGRRLVTGLDEVVDARRAVHPRGGRRRAPASTPTRSAGSPGSWPRRRRPRSTAGSARPPPFGTVTSWLVDVLNMLTGNLDRPGGAMFTTAAAGASNTRAAPFGRGVRLGRPESRVRDLPETFGELPSSCLAEEIETPGEGQIRAMITIAGNPVLSTPDSARLDAALGTLDFMVSIDIYLNETTRHADVILPAPSALQKSHYDVALLQLAVRNVANYSPPVLPLDDGQPDEWEILCRLAMVLQGAGADRLTRPWSTTSASVRWCSPPWPTSTARCTAAIPTSSSRRSSHARAPSASSTSCSDRPLRRRLRRVPDGLPSTSSSTTPHGIDLGPLQPRLPDVLRTPDGMIDLAPEVLRADVAAPAPRPRRSRRRALVLIGRRHLRSNNSWMHNVSVLVKGKPRCTLQLHPDDAAARASPTATTPRSARGPARWSRWSR